MEEENKTETPAQPQAERGELLAGKFKSVDALLHAYGELEAEFTRRSQRLKALEDKVPEKPEAPSDPSDGQAEPQAAHNLHPAISQEALSAAVGEYFSRRGVPLMGAGGTGVVAPHHRPATIAEAGDLALGYIKRQKP